MPRELKDKAEFSKLLPSATEVRIVRGEKSAKVKLRTPEGLFTLETTAEEADSLVKGSKAPTVEY
ncbi:MAG: hypothetical protein HY247_02055 [archaeon]|nr:MAG: hypothetical protein HY247_02055 [archaeon]